MELSEFVLRYESIWISAPWDPQNPFALDEIKRITNRIPDDGGELYFNKLKELNVNDNGKPLVIKPRVPMMEYAARIAFPHLAPNSGDAFNHKKFEEDYWKDKDEDTREGKR